MTRKEDEAEARADAKAEAKATADAKALSLKDLDFEATVVKDVQNSEGTHVAHLKGVSNGQVIELTVSTPHGNFVEGSVHSVSITVKESK